MRKLLRRLTWVALAGPFLVVGAYALMFAPDAGYKLSHNPEDWVRFGEYVGGTLGTFYAFLAFAGLLLTIAEQRRQARRDLQDAKVAARAARQANAISRAAYLSDQRPWVELADVQHTAPPTYSAPDGWKLILKYQLRNLGKSPAAPIFFNAKVIPYVLPIGDPAAAPRGTFTEVAVELRSFAAECDKFAGDQRGFGGILFPSEQSTEATFAAHRGDAPFIAALSSPGYTGRFYVLACASYRSTIDGSVHHTAQAYSLYLEPDPELPNCSMKIEVLADGQASTVGRTLTLEPVPMGGYDVN